MRICHRPVTRNDAVREMPCPHVIGKEFYHALNYPQYAYERGPRPVLMQRQHAIVLGAQNHHHRAQQQI